MTLQEQPRNPLHGLTLERILTDLVHHYGFKELYKRIPVRCFYLDPTISSSLKFLRKTPWARQQLEEIYVKTLEAQRRADKRTQNRTAPSTARQTATSAEKVPLTGTLKLPKSRTT
ncbi:VF530 family protein [Lampropedia aestuarii]|uniref:VF530 family protein n=1 Tax=Lampropedia aestuarii TaxID=2562762 RepID=UPI0024688196|nr:VF530 family protein [Lampropedia aestuarii]MDH5856875.1 VF530 family protein [Lampropedia aestuarii]